LTLGRFNSQNFAGKIAHLPSGLVIEYLRCLRRDGQGRTQIMTGSSLAKITLNGAFRLESAGGQKIQLNSAKAKGMLALLVASSDGECSRAYLKSKLWSDREPSHAAGSLRQALSFLRRVLVPIGVPLISDRQTVSIDQSALDVRLDGDGLFCEDLDIRDPAFIAWVQAQRLARGEVRLSDPHVSAANAPDIAPAPASKWSVAVVPQTEEQGEERWFETVFSDALAKSLQEIFAAPVSVGPAPKVTESLLVVSVECMFAGLPQPMMRVSIRHPANRTQIWSEFRKVSGKGMPTMADADLMRLVNELVEALGDYLIQKGLARSAANDPDHLCRMAIRSMFTLDPDRILEADQWFAQAYEMEPRGLYLAWRAQLRAIQSVEKLVSDPGAARDEGAYYCAKALEIDPNNSMVLATLANALRRFRRDDLRSHELAYRSVQINRNNPMAWSAFSAASSYVDDHDTAYRAAVIARGLVQLTPHRFWWDSQRFVAALPAGKLDEAIKYAERCHVGNPDFRPPLRYLVALYAHDDRIQDALIAAEKLKRLEKDFAIEDLLQNYEYPASLLRVTPGLRLDKLKELV
jgi:tetratricopeptide (TPR) repeat protein